MTSCADRLDFVVMPGSIALVMVIMMAALTRLPLVAAVGARQAVRMGAPAHPNLHVYALACL